MRKMICRGCGKVFEFGREDISYRYVKSKRMNVIVRKERVVHCPVCYTSMLVNASKKVQH